MNWMTCYVSELSLAGKLQVIMFLFSISWCTIAMIWTQALVYETHQDHHHHRHTHTFITSTRSHQSKFISAFIVWNNDTFVKQPLDSLTLFYPIKEQQVPNVFSFSNWVK